MGAAEVTAKRAGLHADDPGDISHRQPRLLPYECEVIGEVFSGSDLCGIADVRSSRVVRQRDSLRTPTCPAGSLRSRPYGLVRVSRNLYPGRATCRFADSRPRGVNRWLISWNSGHSTGRDVDIPGP